MSKRAARYGAFFEATMSVMLIIDPAGGRIVDANPAAAAFYGYTVEQLKTMLVNDLNLLDAGALAKEMERAQGRRANYFRFVHRVASGALRDVDVYSSPIVVGRRRLLASVVHDATELRRAERDLAEAAEKLRGVMAATLDGVVVLDREGHLLEVNDQFAVMLSYAPQGLLRMRVSDLEAQESPEETRRRLAVITQRGYQRFETQLRTGDRRILDVEVSATYVASSDSFLIFLHDITDRKLRERRLAEALALNERIISVSPVGILAYQASGSCVLANPAAEALVGAPADVLTTLDFRKLHSWRESGLYDLAVAALSSGRVHSKELHLITTFGQDRWVQATAVSFTSQDAPHLLLLLQDVGEQKRLLQAELEHARAATELAELRNEFVATVSHELRSPLTAIIGYGELLEGRWDSLPDAQRRDRVRLIVLSANRQLKLVQDLLLLSRLEGGPMRLARTAVDLATQIHRAAEEVEANHRGVHVDLFGPSDLTVLADADRVLQIVVNLADNAAKYSPGGRAVRITWELEQDGLPGDSGRAVWAAMRVKDTGPGVPEIGRDRLFQRFGRVEGSRSRSGHVGTGLGLYLSRQLAEAMGGDLVLETTGAGGSVFRLRLPLAAAT